ncbi:hypothetical protein GHK92_11230 [Nocardioides sp. dk4132]|uniref:hypothetical protein n=1 Tax=unclassified Nocardioides TaxID=2615069 RepID=UPI0012967B82|nr:MULTISPECIES: hypothetical protein [unclassified Nocardioides]MQW76449.1 hypothetical protein [Nocardioides sp. dk4132]QGA07282.1 hypothetical protein GFH29_07705 [Nocardioides sp. dk884]
MPHQLIRFLAVVVFLLGTGVVAGWVWEAVWEAPVGGVQDGRWFPIPTETGLRAQFSGTAIYVLVALAAGLIAGTVIALLTRGGELLTLAAVVVGSAIGGVAMARVGAALGPEDPAALAARAEDGARLVGNLEVTGLSPYGALPFGALLALMVVFFLTAGHGRYDEDRDRPGDSAVSDDRPGPSPLP